MKTYFLPIGLILALALAMTLPEPGRNLAELELTSYLIAAIFFMNGYDFVVKELDFNAKLLIHVLNISLISLLMAPAIAFGMSFVVNLDFYWMLGLFTIACVPTTLSSGIVISAQAGGNKSLAVLLTMVMSFLGVFILPFTLKSLVQAYGEVQIDSLALMIGLCYKVLLPFLLGYMVQRFLLKGYRIGNLLPSSIVVLIVYYSSSKSQALMMSSTIQQILGCVLVSISLHIFLILIDYLYVAVVKMKASNRLSFVFCGSQKTLPLSVAVLAGFSVETGRALVLCICFHFCQLIMDSVLALKLKQVDQS